MVLSISDLSYPISESGTVYVCLYILFDSDTLHLEIY